MMYSVQYSALYDQVLTRMRIRVQVTAMQSCIIFYPTSWSRDNSIRLHTHVLLLLLASQLGVPLIDHDFRAGRLWAAFAHGRHSRRDADETAKARGESEKSLLVVVWDVLPC